MPQNYDPVEMFPDLSRADDLADPRKRLIGIVQYCKVLMKCYPGASDKRWAQRDTIHRLNIDTPTDSEFEQMQLFQLNHFENMCQHYHHQTCQLTEAMRLTMPDLLVKCRVLTLYHDPFFNDRDFDWNAMKSDLMQVQLEVRRQLDEPGTAADDAQVVKPDSAATRSGGKTQTEPCADAFKAYRAHRLVGKSQIEVAKMLGTNQGQISKWVKQVAGWIEAGNVLPPIPGMTTKPGSIDPVVIDMGERQDGRTKRQRGKSRDDE